jgi:hypothetical protein
MDYVAKAQETSRRWREAQGLPPRADLLSDQSFPSSVPRKDGVPQEEEERLARECSTTETIETTEESSKSLPPPSPAVLLNPRAVKEALGAPPDPHALASLRLDVLAAIHQLEAEIQAGTISSRPLLIRGRPLGDWVALSLVGTWLRANKR